MFKPTPYSSAAHSETLSHLTKIREGGRWEGGRQTREERRREIDCHILASFSLFDEIGHPKCVLPPLPPNAYSAAFGCTMGFSSSCAHPHANSHEINSAHPSFYLHHLAEAKTSLPKYPPPDKTYHPIAAVHIHLAYNCLSGLGSSEIRDLFPLPSRFIRGGLSSI